MFWRGGVGGTFQIVSRRQNIYFASISKCHMLGNAFLIFFGTNNVILELVNRNWTKNSTLLASWNSVFWQFWLSKKSFSGLSKLVLELFKKFFTILFDLKMTKRVPRKIVYNDDKSLSNIHFLKLLDPHSKYRFVSFQINNLPRFNSRFWNLGSKKVDAFTQLLTWIFDNLLYYWEFKFY